MPGTQIQFKRIAALIAGWGSLAVVDVIYFGMWPRTPVGWIAFILVSPIVVLIGEGCGEAFKKQLNSLPLSWKITDATKKKDFSVVRVIFALVVATLFFLELFAIGWLIWSLFPDQIRFVAAFLDRHFRRI